MSHSSAARKITRRQLIGGALAAGLGGTALLNSPARPAKAANEGNHHLVWVWQFSTDAEPEMVAARLAKYGMGIIHKTHDGTEWMAEYDTSRYAVSGHPQVQTLANYFEAAGVPFHAWCVLHGDKPIEEARMAAAVLLSGARSIFLDVEPHGGFWRGKPADATAFGTELRRLVPNAEVVLSIDARPWLKNAIPLKEFMPFINAIAPQHYWRTFDTQANYDKYREAGFPVPSEGVTPEFLLATTLAAYGDVQMPIHHTGQGSTDSPVEWARFINAAYALNADFLSVWRYGVTTDDVLTVVASQPPRQPAVAQGVQTGPSVTHVVEAGETLGLIASIYGTTVDAIVEANQLQDANYVYIGQELTIPGATTSASSSGTSAPPPAALQTSTSSASGTTYSVESGDTLYAISARFGTSVSAIAAANNLADPGYIYVGQQLTIP